MPLDLRLLRRLCSLTSHGHHAAQRLWRHRLTSLGLIRVTTTYGFEIIVDPSDHLGWEYAMYGCFEAAASALLWDVLRDGGDFADVGANHGWFSLLAAARLRGSGAAVYSFEPQKRLCDLIEASAEFNGFEHLTVVRAAVGEQRLKGNLDRKSARHSGLVSVAVDSAGAIDIVTLDDYFTKKKAPVAVKIDVEGSELRVLRGMKQLLSRPELRWLYLEVHPPLLAQIGDTYVDVLDMLRLSKFNVAVLSGAATLPKTGSAVAQHVVNETVPSFHVVARRSLA